MEVDQPMPRFTYTYHPAHSVLLLLLLSLPWFLSIPGAYIFDDYITPLNDPASQGLGAFFNHLGATIRPLTKLTYALEATLNLDSVDSRRCLQIFVHALNAVLIFLILRKSYAQEADNPFLPLLISLCYLLHPIHAEKVLAIAGRSTLLMESLLLGATLSILNQRFTLCLVLFGCSILARETALFFAPLFLLVLKPATRRERWLLAVPFVGSLCLLACIPRYWSLFEFSFTARNFTLSCIQQISAIPIGLSLYFRTWKLSIDHGERLATAIADPMFILGLLIIAMLLYLASHKIIHLQLSAVWILAAILPTQSFIPKIDALTERPFALALFGFINIAAFLYYNYLKKINIPIIKRSLLFVTGTLFLVTAQRATLYRSEYSIWRDAMEKSTHNIRPYLNYATILINTNRLDEAQATLIEADAINPFDTDLADKLRMLQYKILLKDDKR